MARIIDLDDVDKTPHSSPVRDLVQLLHLMEVLREKDKKEEEEKKKKDGEKKKSHSGPSDIIGNALILTFIQMGAIPGAIYFWGLAMQSLKAAIVP